MTNKSLLDRLLNWDFASLAELKNIAEVRPEECADIAWKVIMKAGEDGQHVVSGFCTTAAEQMIKVIGKDQTEKRILDCWAEFKDQVRSNICYEILLDPELLSADLALKLYSHPATLFRSKYDIATNLFRTRIKRPISKSVLLALLSDLGSSADSGNKEHTEKIVREMQRELQR